jgi:hypothetical protein
MPGLRPRLGIEPRVDPELKQTMEKLAGQWKRHLNDPVSYHVHIIPINFTELHKIMQKFSVVLLNHRIDAGFRPQ